MTIIDESLYKNLIYKLTTECMDVKFLDRLLSEEEGDVSGLFELILQAITSQCPNYAQLHQDIIVLLCTGFKTNGFFVEFGATDGIDLSNTYLLEKKYGWKGILSEPAKVWHEDLVKNRSADIDFSCVWSKSNEVLSFDMVKDKFAVLSTISSFSDMDQHARKRKNHITYDVNTISLQHLLEKHNAPKKIDYLSIDTEGSELDILSNFDFNSFDISIITCEHNYTKDREKIFNLLTKNGFVRKFTTLSKWDDWYFHESML